MTLIQKIRMYQLDSSKTSMIGERSGHEILLLGLRRWMRRKDPGEEINTQIELWLQNVLIEPVGCDRTRGYYATAEMSLGLSTVSVELAASEDGASEAAASAFFGASVDGASVSVEDASVEEAV